MTDQVIDPTETQAATHEEMRLLLAVKFNRACQIERQIERQIEL